MEIPLDAIDWKEIEEANAELFDPKMRVRIRIWEAAQNFIMNGSVEMTTEVSKALAVFMLEVKNALEYHNIERQED